MFELDDIVEIYPHKPEECWLSSPVMNMQGSIAKIVEVYYEGVYIKVRCYHLEFIEVKANKPELVTGHEGFMRWEDRHLSLVSRDDGIQEIDISTLLAE